MILSLPVDLGLHLVAVPLAEHPGKHHHACRQENQNADTHERSRGRERKVASTRMELARTDNVRRSVISHHLDEG